MKPITPIEAFQEGQKIQGFYLCTEKHVRHTRTGELFLDLTLRDRTGVIHAKIWDKVSQFNERFSSGDPVVVAGVVETFQERPQLVVKRINRASVQYYGRYGYDPALLVPTAPREPKAMWKEIVQSIRTIQNRHLRNLVARIYRENKERLFIAPASVTMHHNYRSGFLEHTLSMAQIGKQIAGHYGVNVDLLLAGIFLHDIGKLREITTGFQAEYTDEGHFLGHIIMGRDMVRETAQTMQDFPPKLLVMLEHMILSHQGHYEWQSPKQPAFKEALLLHLIDFMDARMNLMEKAISEDQNEGNWTDRKNIFRIPLFKGGHEAE
ncbi:MAG: 3'-5' exoribonuclease YhaM family protein [Fidelibacterota bacterium]